MTTISICSSINDAKILNGFPYFQDRIATIEVQPYLAGRIEYQYDDEPKQVIYSTGGDLNYTIEIIEKQCPGIEYAIEYQEAIISSGVLSGWRSPRLKYYIEPYRSDAPYANVFFIASYRGTDYNIITRDNNNYLYHWSYNGGSSAPTPRDRKFYKVQFDTANYQNFVVNIGSFFGIRFLGFKQISSGNCPADCKFTVIETFNDNTTQIRHQETRENCPDVQKFEAGLGDIQTVTKKLKRNEILLASTGQNTNHPILGFFDDKFSNYLQSNPDHCLVIWGIRDNNDVPFKVAQICSAEGSPPPEIVNINCQKEECPDGTCKVVCNDHICCYNAQGFPVKTINK